MRLRGHVGRLGDWGFWMRVLVAERVVFLAGAIALAAPIVGVAHADNAPSSDATTAKQDVSQPVLADPASKKPDAPHAPDTPAVVVDDNNVQSPLGKDVTSAKGEKLGQITDILVSHNGEIRAAVIDFGGFLGVGSRKVAVAWPTLHFSDKGITLGMTRDELRVTPEYHQGEPIVIVGAIAPASQTAAHQAPAADQSAPSTSPAPAK
jgi:hypothetical protein